MTPYRTLTVACATALALGATPAASATFKIKMDYTPAGQPVTDSQGNARQTEAFTERQKDLFGIAGRFWETVLTGFSGGSDMSFAMNASLASHDGAYNVAAYAGPRGLENVRGIDPISGADRTFWRSTGGSMRMDADDYGPRANGRFSEDAFVTVVVHEIAHALGFGTLFNANALLSGTEYIGAAAVAAFNRTHGSALAGIPTLNGGHWSECWVAAASGAACSPSNGSGGSSRLNDTDVMTPILPRGTGTIAPATIASFRDLGFLTIDPFSAIALPVSRAAPVAPVPLPAGGLLLAGGLAGLAAMRRRKKQA